MADLTIEPRPALIGLSRLNLDGLAVSERLDVAIATLAVAHDKFAAADAVMLKEYGVALPPPGKRAASELISFAWTGPGAWLALAAGADDLDRELAKELGALASVTDASGSRTVLRLSGLRAIGVLARGLPLDLHPRVFKTGDCATTHCAHIAATIWRLDDEPTFELAVPRSFAQSFAHWLAVAVASEAAAPL